MNTMKIIRDSLRTYARKLFYSLPLNTDRFIKGSVEQKKSQEYWDTAFTSTQHCADVGGTISIQSRAVTIKNLIEWYGPTMPAILDIGCAGGTLSRKLEDISRYLGTDISQHVIDIASQKNTSGVVTFRRADVREIDEEENEFDVIVFSEMLYFLGVQEAASEVKRICRSLRRAGIVIVSMKEDGGKGSAIWRALARDFDWIDGVLMQAKPNQFDYRIRHNRERPAFLAAVLRLKNH